MRTCHLSVRATQIGEAGRHTNSPGALYTRAVALFKINTTVLRHSQQCKCLTKRVQLLLSNYWVLTTRCWIICSRCRPCMGSYRCSWATNLPVSETHFKLTVCFCYCCAHVKCGLQDSAASGSHREDCYLLISCSTFQCWLLCLSPFQMCIFCRKSYSSSSERSTFIYMLVITITTKLLL